MRCVEEEPGRNQVRGLKLRSALGGRPRACEGRIEEWIRSGSAQLALIACPRKGVALPLLVRQPDALFACHLHSQEPRGSGKAGKAVKAVKAVWLCCACRCRRVFFEVWPRIDTTMARRRMRSNQNVTALGPTTPDEACCGIYSTC